MAYQNNGRNNGKSKEDALKDYIQVNERVMKFYKDYPNGIIDPEIIKWTDDGVIVIQVKIYKTPEDFKNKIFAGKGHAYEKEGASYINKTSALENCETSAIGRALANMGYHINKAMASKEEMMNALYQQRRIQRETSLMTKQTKNDIVTVWKEMGYDLAKINEQTLRLYNKPFSKITEEEARKFLTKLIELKTEQKEAEEPGNQTEPGKEKNKNKEGGNVA